MAQEYREISWDALAALASLSSEERVRFAAEIMQPFQCRCARTCDECRRRLGGHHYHCACGAHLHLTRTRSRDTICFYDHVLEYHRPDMEPHADLAGWQRALLDQGTLSDEYLDSYDIERVALYERQGGVCYYCRVPVDWREGEVDHLYPELKGTPEGESLRAKALSHHPCHRSKTRGRRDHIAGRSRSR